jgi:quercetin dioxygenase-like cupin family protein
MKKSFNMPDETKTMLKTKVEIVKLGDMTILRNTFEPGWKWSEHIKPAAGTDRCQMHHVLYGVSGHLKAVMEDGTEIDVEPGDIADIPPGHDAWVVGDEPEISIDIAGAIKT